MKTLLALALPSITSSARAPFFRILLAAGLFSVSAKAAPIHFTAIAAGPEFSLYVTGNGRLWAMGYNTQGELGDGTYVERKTPVPVADDVIAVAAGGGIAGGYTLYISSEGKLYGTGRNNYGQLGDGTTTTRCTFALVSGTQTVIAAVAGQSHSLFVTSDGKLWAMGANFSGQLGDGTTTNRKTPVQVLVPDDAPVVAVAAGTAHSLFVTGDGKLWAMGNNFSGQLGDRTTIDRNIPVHVADNVVAVSAGDSHSFYITADKKLWFTGHIQVSTSDPYYRYHTNNPFSVADNVVAASAGNQTGFYIDTDGKLWGIGNNYSRQLGFTGAQYQQYFTSFVEVAKGDAVSGFIGKKNAVSAGGGAHTLFVIDEGNARESLAGMGASDVGQLGDQGNNFRITIPSQVVLTTTPASQSVGIASGSSGFSLENTGYGEMNWSATMAPGGNWARIVSGTSGGNTGTVTISHDANPLGGAQRTASIIVSAYESRVASMHSDVAGSPATVTITQAANPYPTFDNLITPVAGRNHNLYATSDGKLWAMGRNNWSQLGIGNTSDRNSPMQVTSATNVIAASAGAAYSLYVTDDGKLWGMGSNSRGQLGVGDTTDRLTPAQAPFTANVTVVTAGDYHSLFATSDGKLWAMGDNYYGQLGLSDTTNRNAPVQVTSAANVIAASAGGDHSLYVTGDGKLWAMGRNDWGQLGVGGTMNRSSPVQVTSATNVIAVAAGYGHSLYVTSDGKLWAMGANYDGQLGVGGTTNRLTPVQVTSATNVVVVAAGVGHSLYATGDGKLWAMGRNNCGQLGIGDNTDRLTPVQVASATNVIAVAAGEVHSLYATGDSKLWAMGDNYYGQLGLGDNNNRRTPVLVLDHSGVSHCAPIITTHPTNRAIYASQNTTFTVVATGTPAPTCQWQSSTNGSTWSNLSNAAPYGGVTTSMLSIANVSAAFDSTQYRCIATNPAGTATSNPATLTVNTGIDPETLAQQYKTQLEASGTATVTISGTVDFSLVGNVAVASGKTIVGADAAATIAGGLTIFGSETNIVILGVNFTGAALNIVSARDIHVSHCTFTDTYLWVGFGADNITFSWNIFTATSSGSGSAMTISASGPTTGIILDHNLWGDGLKSDMPSAISARVHMFNNYFAASPAAGNTTATIAGVHTQILSLRNIYQGVNNPLTKQSNGLLRAIGNFMDSNTGTTAPGDDRVFVPAYSYLMNSAGHNTPSAADLVQIIISHAGNTDGKNSVTPAATDGTASISAKVTGLGTTTTTTAYIPTAGGFTLTANAIGFEPIACQWYRDNFAITGATAATHAVISATAAVHAGVYAVELTTPAGEIVASGGFTVTVGPSITTHPVSQTVTAGGSAPFTVVAAGESLAYQWQKDGIAISGATSTSYTIANAQSANAGSYRVIVSNSDGSAISNAATLTVNPVDGGNNNGGGGSAGGGGGGASSLWWLAAAIALLAIRSCQFRD